MSDVIEVHRPKVPEWGPGPWMDEPDVLAWVDQETGLDCLLNRGPMGAWNGYVGIPEGHSMYGKAYQDIDEDIVIHGGLTYAGEKHPVSEIPEILDRWWFGFDCAHYMDYIPQMRAYSSAAMYADDPNDIYRDIEFARNEVLNLTRQLKS